MHPVKSTNAPTVQGSIPTPPRPAWWLPGPHLPTIYGKMMRRVAPVPTTRERFELPDGDLLSVERMRGRPDAPRLVLFHGLEGSTRSMYTRGLLHLARQRGWWGDLVLWRTCDGEPVNSVPRAYHSGASDDADAVIRRIVAADPGRPTMLLGVSLGGNVLLKWLGEQGSAVPSEVKAAVAVSVPFDLARCSRQIEQGFAAVYGRFFMKGLKAKTFAKLERFPGLVDPAALERVRTIWEFDDVVTAPIHGFASAEDYYRRASSLQFLDRVRVPSLLFNAADDPFLPRPILDEVRAVAAQNPYLQCHFPEHGGHVGFIAGAHPWKARYWMEEDALAWAAPLLDAV